MDNFKFDGFYLLPKCIGIIPLLLNLHALYKLKGIMVSKKKVTVAICMSQHLVTISVKEKDVCLQFGPECYRMHHCWSCHNAPSTLTHQGSTVLNLFVYLSSSSLLF